MKIQQVFVRAQDPNGKWGAADVMDIDDKSFRAFVIDMLMRAGVVVHLKDEVVEREDITYYTEVPFEKE